MATARVGSAIGSRPFLGFTVDILRDRLDRHPDDLALRRSIVRELSFRTTRAAAELKQQVESEIKMLEQPARVPAAPAKRPPSSTAPRPVVPTPRVQQVRPRRDDSETAYQLLLKLHSAESEPLFRWGVSSLLPKAKVLEILAWWEKEVSGSPDALGRCQRTLQSDRQRFLDEHAALDRKTHH